jgi:phytoene synthase
MHMDAYCQTSGFRESRALTRKHAKTFYFASRLLPREKMQAAYAVYAFCRVADDSVDLSDQAQADLIRAEQRLEKAYSNQPSEEAILLAFRQTVNKYHIPRAYFDDLLKGIRMDLTKTRYHDFRQLCDYCYKVAGVVGLIMLKIFGSRQKEAESYAVDLGIAMQLTNILRDIGEDYRIGRLYLPRKEMDKFGVEEKQIADSVIDANLIRLLKFQIARARDYYRNADKGIKMIANLRSRLVVNLMSRMYAGILLSIENNNYDIFSNRAHMNIFGKLSILFKVLIKAKYL